MLEISFRNGSHSDPLVGPKMVTKSCQTEPPPPTANTTATTSNISATLSPAPSTANEKSPSPASSGKSSFGFSSGNRPLDENHENNGRASLNGTSSPNPSSDNLIRPLSSASEESEETSSISDDDEIIFNTIRRQVKKPSDVILSKNLFVNNSEVVPAEDSLTNNCEDERVVVVEAECDGEIAVNPETLKNNLNKESNEKEKHDDHEKEGLVKVNGDTHLSDCLKEQQKEVLSQS